MDGGWFSGFKFTKGGESISMKAVILDMQDDNDAQAMMKSARSTYTLAQITGGIGGFMIGWPLGTAIAGGEPNWTFAGIGTAIAVASIPIYKSSERKAKSAIDGYNSRLTALNERGMNSEVQVSLNGTGLKLKLSF